MRIIIAALLGAIVMFLWEFVAHMWLPVGEMGMRAPQNEDVVLQAATSGMTQPGIYMLPYLGPEKMNDPVAMKAAQDKAVKNPYVFAVVAPSSPVMVNMVPNLIKQFIGDYFGALIIALILGANALSFVTRVLGALGFGLFGWFENIVPLWNWYQFPPDFLVGNLIEQGVGWLLAGVAIAWWLGRRFARR